MGTEKPGSSRRPGTISSSAFFKQLTEADSKRYEADILQAHEEGRQAGYTQARIDILSWLQTEYVDDSSLDRRSPEAKAMLELASRLQSQFGKGSH